jgi:hypothetical protein
MPSFSRGHVEIQQQTRRAWDGNQSYTELHEDHTEFHGGRMMALRAEPALARSAQIIYSVKLRVNSVQLRVPLMPLAARGTE